MSKWQAKRLDEIALKIGDGIHATPKYSEHSSYKFINGNNITQGRVVIVENTKSVDETEFNKHKVSLDDSTILMSINGTIGSLAYYRGEKVVLGKSVAYINCSESVLRPYLFAFLSSNQAQKHFEYELTGSTIRNLSLKTIRETQVELPDVDEQRRIVAVLEIWDEYIEKLNNKLELKNVEKTGLMRELMTGKKRLDGFTTDWYKHEIGQLLSYEQPGPYIVNDTDYKDNGTPVLTANKSFILGYTHEPSGVYDRVDNGVIIFDDFTMSSKFVDFDFKVKSSAIKILRTIDSEVNIKFIFERMQLISTTIGEHKRNYISEYQYNIVGLPSLAEQDAIAEISNILDEEIRLLKSKMCMISNQKIYLLNNLLTGTIRTPENLTPKEPTNA